VKGIGAFVLLLLVALGVATFLVTRPADRTLSGSERGWVTKYVAWTGKTERVIDRAYVGMGFSTAAKNSRLLAPLRACSDSFQRLGPRPTALRDVDESARTACGEAEYAVGVNDRFATASLATTKRHLRQAGEWLHVSRRQLHERFDVGT
jgi:hypothetical protein